MFLRSLSKHAGVGASSGCPQDIPRSWMGKRHPPTPFLLAAITGCESKPCGLCGMMLHLCLPMKSLALPNGNGARVAWQNAQLSIANCFPKVSLQVHNTPLLVLPEI